MGGVGGKSRTSLGRTFPEHRAQLLIGLSKDFLRCRPVDTSVSDRDSSLEVFEVSLKGLIAEFEVALKHHTDDRLISFKDLIDAVLKDQGLKARILQRISVTAINDNIDRQFGVRKRFFAKIDADTVVVRPTTSPSEDQVPVAIPACLDDTTLSITVDPQKMMGMTAGLDGIDGDLDVSIRAILKSHWSGKTTRHLSMTL